MTDRSPLLAMLPPGHKLGGPPQPDRWWWLHRGDLEGTIGYRFGTDYDLNPTRWLPLGGPPDQAQHIVDILNEDLDRRRARLARHPQ